jgi:hypothetical protein
MSEVFTIVPGGRGVLWFSGIFITLFAVLLVGSFYVVNAARATRFVLDDEGLSIRRTLYGRTIPWRSLRAEEARVVNFWTDSELQPRRRTNGIGMPGYSAGWFALRGGEKGLLFVTDPQNVVHIPTLHGYHLLASVQDPEAFVAAVRQRASRPS